MFNFSGPTCEKLTVENRGVLGIGKGFSPASLVFVRRVHPLGEGGE